MHPCVYLLILVPCSSPSPSYASRPQLIIHGMPNRSMSIPNRTAHSVCSYKKCKISHVTCEMQVILCYCKVRAGEAQNQAEVGVSAERFRGDAGRPLVAAHHS